MAQRVFVSIFSKLLIAAAIATAGSFFYSHDAHAAKPDVTISEVNDLCSNLTQWGYYERMYLTDSSGNGLDTNSVINVPIGATSVPVNFKIDLWFCEDRVEDPNSQFPVKTCRYALIKQTTSYTRQDCTGSWSGAPNNLLTNIVSGSEYTTVFGPSTHPGGTRHYKMTTQVHSANLQVSSLNEGVNKLCYGSSLTSMDPNGFNVNGGRRCVDVRIKFGWEPSGTTTLRVDGTVRSGTPPVSVGSNVVWSHEIKNSNDGAIDKGIKSWLVNGGRTPATSNTATSATPIAPGGTVRTVSGNYTIAASDVGKTICQRITWSPLSSANSGTRSTSNRCVTVPRNFDLKPAISGLGGSVSPGATVTVRPSVVNQVPSPGVTTSTPSTIKWQLSRFTLSPGVTKPADVLNGPVATAPCAYFSGSCPPGSGDTGTKVFSPGANPFPILANEKIDSNLPLGTQVCYGLSVSPPTDEASASSWRHVSICLTVNKRPTIQVWGGDVRAGSILTNTSIGAAGAQSATYGSWGEYGVFARGLNDDMASGSGLVGGLVSGSTGSATQSQYHHLTFANVNSSGYGNFDFTSAGELSAQFTSLAGTATFPASGLVGTAMSPDVSVYRPSTDVTLKASTFATGKTVIINAPNRTVTIEGDITYSNGPYSSPAQIPQLIIVARNIYIKDSVEQLDAWLLTSRTNGVIDTCSNVGTAGSMPASGGTLAEGVCKDTLTVHGPVATKKLVLKRTAGATAGSDRDKPAEQFNLRPDAYMWLRAWTQRNAQAWSTGASELPPRY